MDNLRLILRHPTTLLSLLILATVLLAMGLVMPVMTIKTLVFMRHSFSVLSGIYDLLLSGKYFLFLIVAVFSLVLPIAKLVLLFGLVLGLLKHKPRTQQYLTWLHDHGRWAMLDVFVVALLVVSIKLGDVANVVVHMGFYVFATAVLLIMWITHLTAKLFTQSN